MKRKVLTLLIGCVIASLLLTSCDGFLGVDGRVYEWVDAPAGAKGEIYVDLKAPTDRITKPISGAKVYIKYLWPVTTDDKGAFQEGSIVPPFYCMPNITVEKEGFHTLTGSFQHPGSDSFDHFIIVFLVRE